MKRTLSLVLTVLLVGSLAFRVLEAHADAATSYKVDFAPSGALAAAGYVADIGSAFDAGRGFGWVAQGSSAPLSLVGNGRERNAVADQRLDTLMHMQFTGSSGGVNSPGRWEHVLPAGIYDVTVAVGDASYFNSVHRLTVEGTLAVNNFTPSASTPFKTVTVQVDVSDGRLTVDAAGGTNTKIDYVDIEAVTDPSPPISARIDFAPSGALAAAGYVTDIGSAFDAGRGYGWVAQGSSTPLSLVGNGRERNAVADQRLDTLMHMQYTGSSGGVNSPGRWEHVLPAGTYDVTVAVGDASFYNSVHRLTVEGTLAVNNFAASSSTPFKTVTVQVAVSDGRLTLDAAGGTNTKIDYIDIGEADGPPPPPPPPPPPNGGFTWTTVAAAPQARSEAQGAVVDGKFYVFGGYTDGTFVPSTRADVYNPATNAWSPIAPLPKSLTHAGSAVDGRFVYLAGGYTARTGGGQIFAITDVFRYSVDTNTWTTMTPLPGARGSGALIRVGRQLHFFGGVDINRADRGEHWILNLDSPTAWTPVVALPNPRSHMGQIAFQGKIYAIGGERGYNTNGVAQTSVHVWDPASPNTWTALAGLPAPRSHTAAATFELNGRIYIAGGESGPSQPQKTVYGYDPSSNTWQTTTPLPANRHSGVAGVIGGAVYFAGGSFSTTVYKGVPN